MTDKFTNIPAAYEIVSLEYIDEIKSQAALLRHKKTGARVAVLANDDENKTFNIGFGPRQKTAQVLLTLWNILYCAVQRNSRPRIPL